MALRRDRRSEALAWQVFDLAHAASQVFAHRMTRMALAGASPTRRDRNEFYLMGAEKFAAFYESWNAMLVEMLRAQLKLSLSAAPFFWLPWAATTRPGRRALARSQQAALGILGKGVAPVRRRAVANARRLRRTR